ncbi:MAG: Sec-independent protein translocase protein TatB [gamma proteobacterium symbiont of Bathyaustriella thionipta]|nr:Sec-independent protein translocase protein TatB [gamma proteobacterium symbiont of Bathyaustriella thionipta]MCU7949780.1 Sec-independent protein translocase protein TatB [gamma proteobacterium symbiont of Bathyaustriella thionipta]MCU7951994.1 Sec-independent protein translocase protein TatB [gamma proteobacterium symbiont of Bathyaustriella thionipta]MCU7956365.1 Sec-independent protein translocase protein TatB [gamma proteobacterium symbiont of Bathyaustriella thionipta]MCU7968720.1 Sec-
MFDIGFWELSIIGIVALLVIGPERLPAVARTVGKYVGRANRFVSNIKDDISKELKDEDLKKILADQQKLADEYKAAASSMNASISSETESLRGNVTMDDILDIEESDQKPAANNNSEKQASEQTDSSESVQAGTEKS